MKKIISLFKRRWDGDRQAYNEVTEGAEWVIAGEGIATVKLDGTCCMIRGGKFFKRYEMKSGGKAPPNFEAATGIDPETGKVQGWVPVGNGPEDQWHRQAFSLQEKWADGTYELIGPKVQGNPEQNMVHELIPHGLMFYNGGVRDFESIKASLAQHDYEGIVWHHPDGRMVKIKKKDFGLPRKPTLCP